jgi:hypothetical protein
LAVLSPVAITYQNFSRLDSQLIFEKDTSDLNQALTSAIETSDAEHRAQKQAIEGTQIVKKKQKRKPTAIYDGNALGDEQETIVSESSLLKE